MNATILNLLTRDGALSVRFEPPLDEQHYDELYKVAREMEDPRDLRAMVQSLAGLWGRTVVID